MIERVERIASCTALCNGVNGQLFAIGGLVLPFDGQGILGAWGSRCPIRDPIDPWLGQHVLPKLAMEESADSTSGDLIQRFQQHWLNALVCAPGTLLVLDGAADSRFEMNFSFFHELCMERRGVDSGMRMRSLDTILKQLGIGPDERPQFETKVLGGRLEESSYHPAQMAAARAKLARMAYLLGAKV